MPWLFTTVAEVNEGGDKPSSEESLDPVTLRNEASYAHVCQLERGMLCGNCDSPCERSFNVLFSAHILSIPNCVQLNTLCLSGHVLVVQQKTARL